MDTAISFLKHFGKVQLARENNIINARLHVGGDVVLGASFDGLFVEFAIGSTELAAARLGGNSGHAAAFVGQLGLTGVHEDLGIRRRDLPFEAKVFKVVHDASITSDHVTSVVVSEHTKGSFQVFRASSDLDSHEMLGRVNVKKDAIQESDFEVTTALGELRVDHGNRISVTQVHRERAVVLLFTVQVNGVHLEFHGGFSDFHSSRFNVGVTVLDGGAELDIEVNTFFDVFLFEEDQVAFSVKGVALVDRPAVEMGITTGSSHARTDNRTIEVKSKWTGRPISGYDLNENKVIVT
mmetsp:Transcript_20291/g.38427  ORF Transcript_20291/g.38427 Transcript_20291/m.38427 type:complete len:295 (+) Transcript_20291:173-1057(+)